MDLDGDVIFTLGFALNDVIALFHSEICHTGGVVDMQGTGNHTVQIRIDGFHQTVAVGILTGPVVTALPDNESNGCGICIGGNGGDHFSVLFSKGIAADSSHIAPGVQIPVFIVVIRTAVMELDGYRTLGSGNRKGKRTGDHHNSKKHYNSQKQADTLLHDDPP